MSKQSVFAYSIAGIALAITIAVVAGTTLGLSGGSAKAGPALAAPATVADGGADAPSVQVGTAGAGNVEYVYVDDVDDDDDHERDEHDDKHEQRIRLFGWLHGVRTTDHDD